MQQSDQAPLAHNIPDACRRIGVGRSSIYGLIKSGEIRAIKIAGRTLIPEEDLQRIVSDRLKPGGAK
ncbi:helix-turn-helix domain-containing protein [Cognatiluteimonas telluris]|uniref:helix-turn-helix domain-containing protein n=1 Tax=Cognatiluteimonas telluris TaxID=1104775 RepID=UPI0014079174|nr:helix-turn-helix domain-containing protein [Lysobacter telluris]